MATTTINRNLTRTARDLGVSLGALLEANPQITNPNAIRSGTELNIPGKRQLSARENAKQMARVFEATSAADTFDYIEAYGGSIFSATRALLEHGMPSVGERAAGTLPTGGIPAGTAEEKTAAETLREDAERLSGLTYPPRPPSIQGEPPDWRAPPPAVDVQQYMQAHTGIAPISRTAARLQATEPRRPDLSYRHLLLTRQLPAAAYSYPGILTEAELWAMRRDPKIPERIPEKIPVLTSKRGIAVKDPDTGEEIGDLARSDFDAEVRLTRRDILSSLQAGAAGNVTLGEELRPGLISADVANAMWKELGLIDELTRLPLENVSDAMIQLGYRITDTDYWVRDLPTVDGSPGGSNNWLATLGGYGGRSYSTGEGAGRRAPSAPSVGGRSDGRYNWHVQITA